MVFMTPFGVYAQTQVPLIPGTKFYSGTDACSTRLKEEIAKINKMSGISSDEREKLKDQAESDNSKTCYEFLEPLPAVDSSGNAAEATAIEITPTEGISGTFNNMYGMAIGIGSVLAVIMIALYGFRYMSGNKSVYENGKLKEKITNVVLGLLLLLGIYVILNTINPRLLDVQPEMGEISLVSERISDPKWLANVSDMDTTGIIISDATYGDITFLAYMGHQQGSAGGPAIIWAAKNNLSSVPAKNPYTDPKTDVNKNMRGNIGSDFQKITGTTVVTPANFMKYWATKIEAFKKSTNSIPTANKNALEKASKETNVPLITITAICRIESYGCKDATAGKGETYQGLFQMGKTEFAKYIGKYAPGDIFNPEHNAYAGAQYIKYNITTLQNAVKNMK